jgi:hypothetical protein
VHSSEECGNIDYNEETDLTHNPPPPPPTTTTPTRFIFIILYSIETKNQTLKTQTKAVVIRFNLLLGVGAKNLFE